MHGFASHDSLPAGRTVMRSTRTQIFAATVAAGALLAAGCGGNEPSPRAPVAQPPSAGMPVAQYVEEVGGLRQAIDDARSDYYHADHTRPALRRGTTHVQSAYADAAQQLKSIQPPEVAKDLHAKLDTLWRKRARELQQVLATNPFDTHRIDDLMAQTGRDTITDEIYTLPQ